MEYVMVSGPSLMVLSSFRLYCRPFHVPTNSVEYYLEHLPKSVDVESMGSLLYVSIHSPAIFCGCLYTLMMYGNGLIPNPRDVFTSLIYKTQSTQQSTEQTEPLQSAWSYRTATASARYHA